MTRHQRFALWALAVSGALSSPLWLMFVEGRPGLVAAVAQSLASLTAVLFLLRSSPSKAIRLPKWASVMAIVAGCMWMMSWRAFADRWLALGITAVAALVIIAVVAQRRWERVWVSVLWLWHPLLVVKSYGSSSSPMHAIILLVAGACALVTMWSVVACSKRQWPVVVWLIGCTATIGYALVR